MTCPKCKAELAAEWLYCPFCGRKIAPTPRKYKKRANGTGSVYKVKDGRKKPWSARKAGVFVGYFATEREAWEALARLVDKKVTDTYNYTFREVYEAWKETHYKNVSKATQYQYDYSFGLFAPLHNRKFRDIDTAEFQAVLDQYSDKSVNTVAKHKQLITQLSEWAIEHRLQTVNYAAFCEVHGKKTEHHIPFTAEDIRKIEADGSETARVVLMLLATGMRINELFTLKLADYHGDYCVGGEKTEAGRERIIPIRAEGRQHFEYFAARSKGERLIDGYSGAKIPNNFRNRDYARLLNRLGIDKNKTPHSTRTTYGTRAATAENLAPAVLQKVLGHSDFNTTQKYYNNPDAAQLVAAVDKASGANSGAN